jgi:coproporphyrinogen III oxidase-like Fe-S oxidoreductase
LENIIDEGGLKRLTDGGFMETDEAGLRTTASGRLCLNEVLRQLLANF